MWSKSQWESSCLSSKVSSAAWLCPSLPIKSQYSSNKVFFQGTVKVLIKLFLSAFWSNVTAWWWWWWTMCAITSRWCKSRLNLVAGLSEKVSRRILVFHWIVWFQMEIPFRNRRSWRWPSALQDVYELSCNVSGKHKEHAMTDSLKSF